MLYAITIEPLNGIYFVYDQPDDNPWQVQEGVELDILPIYGEWTPDRGPFRQILCVSIANPNSYRVFLHSGDIAAKEFRPTGRRFGGLFSKASWERFAKTAPELLATFSSWDDEPLDAPEGAVVSIAQGG